MTGTVSAVLLKAVNSGLLDTEPKEQVLPLSLSELTDIQEEVYEVGQSFHQTLLLSHRTVHHRPAYSLDLPGDLPDLLYSVTEVKAPLFYGWCKDQYLEGRLTDSYLSRDAWYTSADAAPWGAKEAYVQLDGLGNPKTTFLLFYEKTIVLIHFDWEPTQEQMETVCRKLGS